MSYRVAQSRDDNPGEFNHNTLEIRAGAALSSEEIDLEKSKRTSRNSRSMEQRPALALVRDLCAELNVEGIAYCHWKSTASLDRSATGDNDLDLLIGRADIQRFTSTLSRLGFRQAQAPVALQVPGVLDYYGYDQGGDRLVHVHAHYQLVIGHDATKNYRIPIERQYLESAVQGDLFKVPAPEFELLLFVIRMVLKHSTWDTIIARQGNLSTVERRELAYLRAKASLKQIHDLLKQHLPCIDAALFDRCMRSLQPDCPPWTRAKVGRKLQRELRAHARRSQVADISLKLWRRVTWPIRWRVFGHSPKKLFTSGGSIVAIVGGDGAGKSTAVEELYTWISTHFRTIKIHMGKPNWSCATIAVRAILKIGRWLGLYPFTRVPIRYTLDTDSVEFPGYPWLLRATCRARDRYLTYVRARRFSSNGGVVISDRFPLPQVRFMDRAYQSERIANSGQANWLIKSLTRLQTEYYQSILMPELLIVLSVDPSIAVERKTDEDATSVRARCTEIRELDWRQSAAHVIDANESKADVLSTVKALVWSQL